MPFGLKPACVSCTATSSSIWRKDPNGDILCHNCATSSLCSNGKDNENGNGDHEGKLDRHGRSAVGSHFVGTIRKSARLKPSKYRYQPTTRSLPTKGKSRRVIFKKNVSKAPSSVATVISSDHIFINGQYHQVGDVVSLMDHDGGIYYAQVRGFLQDQYMERSAVITWLLPTTASPESGFDPATFILGPEEDFPRRMDCLEFVCHAPTEYFKAKLAPYPTRPVHGTQLSFVWSSMGPQIIPEPSHAEIFGLSPPRPEPKEKLPREKKGDVVKGEGKKAEKEAKKVEVVKGDGKAVKEKEPKEGKEVKKEVASKEKSGKSAVKGEKEKAR